MQSQEQLSQIQQFDRQKYYLQFQQIRTIMKTKKYYQLKTQERQNKLFNKINANKRINNSLDLNKRLSYLDQLRNRKQQNFLSKVKNRNLTIQNDNKSMLKRMLNLSNKKIGIKTNAKICAFITQNTKRTNNLIQNQQKQNDPINNLNTKRSNYSNITPFRKKKNIEIKKQNIRIRDKLKNLTSSLETKRMSQQYNLHEQISYRIRKHRDSLSSLMNNSLKSVNLHQQSKFKIHNGFKKSLIKNLNTKINLMGLSNINKKQNNRPLPRTIQILNQRSKIQRIKGIKTQNSIDYEQRQLKKKSQQKYRQIQKSKQRFSFYDKQSILQNKQKYFGDQRRKQILAALQRRRKRMGYIHLDRMRSLIEEDIKINKQQINL